MKSLLWLQTVVQIEIVQVAQFEVGFIRRILSNLIDCLDEITSVQNCFAADSLITLVDGKQKMISELHSGDRVLAFDDKTKEIIATDVITMLDNQPNQYGSLFQSCFFSSYCSVLFFSDI
jgi:hypothetical protein